MKEMKTLNEKQVGRQLVANVLLLINEVNISIYRFLASRHQKRPKVASIDPTPVLLLINEVNISIYKFLASRHQKKPKVALIDTTPV